jgi:hypothetical protein
VEIAVAASAVEYFPAKHKVHASVPLVVLYLPAKHAAQEPPFGPVYPAAHSQLASAELPAGDTAKVDGQAIQSVTVVMAVDD